MRFVTKVLIKNQEPEGQTHHIVGRRVIIQEIQGYERCLLLIAHFYIIKYQQKMDTSKTDFDETEKQIITIKCFPLDHQNDRLKITPFQHKLYDPPTLGEVISITKVMLEKCQIILNKRTGILQLSTQNIDELHTQLIQQSIKSMGIETIQKEKTLKARMALQRERFHQKYFMNINTPMRLITSEADHISIMKPHTINRAVKTIQMWYRLQRVNQNDKVLGIKNQLMITNNLTVGRYIQNQSVLSTYTFNNTVEQQNDQSDKLMQTQKLGYQRPKQLDPLIKDKLGTSSIMDKKLIQSKNQSKSQSPYRQPSKKENQPICLNLNTATIILQKILRAKQTQQMLKLQIQHQRFIKKVEKAKGKLVKTQYVKLQESNHEYPTSKLFLAKMYSKQKNSEEFITVEVFYENKVKLQGYLLINTQKALKSNNQSQYKVIMESIRLINGAIFISDQNIDQFSPLKEYIPELQATPIVKVEEFQNKQCETEQKLVYNLQRQEEGEDMIYNVIYSGSQPLTLNQSNAQVSVNLTQLMRLYPDLDFNDKSLMTTIGQQLIEGIRMKDGKIFVNDSKIKQNVLVVESMDMTVQQLEQTSSSTQKTITLKNKNLQTLGKYTKYYQKAKYLITVKYEERPIPRIVKPSNDETFQQFEAVYEMSAQNLSQKNVPQIQWFITNHEAFSLCKSHNRLDVARYFMNRTQILGTQFLFLADSREDLQKIQLNKNVVITLEASIKCIQSLLPNRRNFICRKSFKQEIKTWKDQVGSYLPGMYVYTVSSLKSANGEFIILCGEKKDVQFSYIAWNLSNFKRYTNEIPKSSYFSFIHDINKKRTLAQIIVDQYITYDEQNDVIQMELPSPDDLLIIINNTM